MVMQILTVKLVNVFRSRIWKHWKKGSELANSCTARLSERNFSDAADTCFD